MSFGVCTAGKGGLPGTKVQKPGGLPVSVFLPGLWLTFILHVHSSIGFGWPPLTLLFPTALTFSVRMRVVSLFKSKHLMPK